MFETALDCVVTMDSSGRIVEFNPAAERTFGYRAGEAAGREMAELIVPPGLRERHRRGLARYLSDGRARLLDRRIEITGMRANGDVFPIELTITRVRRDGPALFTGYLRDISDRKRTESELRASRARIVQAEEETRRRMERDLHDGAQQQLVQVALTLGSARDALAGAPAQAGELLDAAIAQLAEAAAELREFARGVYPAALTEGGLEVALPALARRSPIPVRLTAATGRLNPAVEATAYFVVAEALTNVARHAQAERATVDVICHDDVLLVEIADDGRGGAGEHGGSGLRGLADRVTALDGRLDVHSPPGGGTTLRVELPCGS